MCDGIDRLLKLMVVCMWIGVASIVGGAGWGIYYVFTRVLQLLSSLRASPRYSLVDFRLPRFASLSIYRRFASGGKSEPR